jgi:hypothetical protein
LYTPGGEAIDILNVVLEKLVNMPELDRNGYVRVNYSKYQRRTLNYFLKLASKGKLPEFIPKTNIVSEISTAQNYVTSINLSKSSRGVIEGLQYNIKDNKICLHSPGGSTVNLSKDVLKSIFQLSEYEREVHLKENYISHQRRPINKLIKLVKEDKLRILDLQLNSDPGEQQKLKKKPEQRVKPATPRQKPVNAKKYEYTTIEGTVFSYAYDGEVLFFKSEKTAPAKINRKAYNEMIALDEEKLNRYIFNNFEQRELLLVKKAMHLAKTDKVVFFDMAPPQPEEWKEPGINNIIKAALKRERTRVTEE